MSREATPLRCEPERYELYADSPVLSEMTRREFFRVVGSGIAILDCSKRGGFVLDVFAGSGTTLIAAEKTGRRGFGIEIDPHYIDTVIRRFDEVYGLKAIHEESKLDFATLCIQRSPEEKRNGKKAQEGKRQRAKSRPR